jgi:ankyrin repeat protein
VASENGHADVVRLLLKYGANVHANDEVTLVVASENGHADVVRLLLKYGADVHADGDAALVVASKGRKRIVRLLRRAARRAGEV